MVSERVTTEPPLLTFPLISQILSFKPIKLSINFSGAITALGNHHFQKLQPRRYRKHLARQVVTQSLQPHHHPGVQYLQGEGYRFQKSSCESNSIVLIILLW